MDVCVTGTPTAVCVPDSQQVQQCLRCVAVGVVPTPISVPVDTDLRGCPGVQNRMHVIYISHCVHRA